jgi:hypothetical protein
MYTYITFFSHPDFTVGLGISPSQLLAITMYADEVADFTAGRELHPAPKNFPLLN